MSNKKFFGLSDEVIFQLRELLQLSILTNTHIVDHLRQLRLTESKERPDFLEMTPEYKEYFLKNIEKMLDEVNEIKKQLNTDTRNS
jgi:hypothetical protein